ncbi:hypothetical protein [Labedella populi]|uniref:hypothetical protein n=1 Tax=Labedella populi TaxID=2498850 RepID=UPI001AA04C25|nr:hypothetical protein [Labedella populi]
MASIHLHSDRLEIRLTAAEKALSLRRENVEIPRSSIRSATLTDDPWIWVRGVRGKGAAIPLTLAVGQWKSHGGTDFLVIKKGSRPAVVLDVVDAEYSRVIVSTNHGAELVAALRLAEDEARAKKVRATRVRTVSPRPIAVRAKAEAAKVEAAKAKSDASAAKPSGRSSVAKKAAGKGEADAPVVKPAKATKGSKAAGAAASAEAPAATKATKAATKAATKVPEGSRTDTRPSPRGSRSTKASDTTSGAPASSDTTPAKRRTRASKPAESAGTATGSTEPAGADGVEAEADQSTADGAGDAEVTKD